MAKHRRSTRSPRLTLAALPHLARAAYWLGRTLYLFADHHWHL